MGRKGIDGAGSLQISAAVACSASPHTLSYHSFLYLSNSSCETIPELWSRDVAKESPMILPPSSSNLSNYLVLADHLQCQWVWKKWRSDPTCWNPAAITAHQEDNSHKATLLYRDLSCLIQGLLEQEQWKWFSVFFDEYLHMYIYVSPGNIDTYLWNENTPLSLARTFKWNRQKSKRKGYKTLINSVGVVNNFYRKLFVNF